MSDNLEVSALPARVLNYTAPSLDFGPAPGLGSAPLPQAPRNNPNFMSNRPRGGARNSSRPVECWYCGISGHYRRDCRKRQRDEQLQRNPAPPRVGQGNPSNNANYMSPEMQTQLNGVGDYFRQQWEATQARNPPYYSGNGVNHQGLGFGQYPEQQTSGPNFQQAKPQGRPSVHVTAPSAINSPKN